MKTYTGFITLKSDSINRTFVFLNKKMNSRGQMLEYMIDFVVTEKTLIVNYGIEENEF